MIDHCGGPTRLPRQLFLELLVGRHRSTADVDDDLPRIGIAEEKVKLSDELPTLARFELARDGDAFMRADLGRDLELRTEVTIPVSASAHADDPHLLARAVANHDRYFGHRSRRQILESKLCLFDLGERSSFTRDPIVDDNRTGVVQGGERQESNAQNQTGPLKNAKNHGDTFRCQNKN